MRLGPIRNETGGEDDSNSDWNRFCDFLKYQPMRQPTRWKNSSRRFGSAYLCANFGIEGKLQHAQYMKSWLNVLEDKGDEVLAEAFVSAQKAAEWVLKESRKQRQRANEGRFGNFQDEAY